MHTVSRLLSTLDSGASHDCGYLALLNQLATPVVVFDSKRQLMFANAAAERSMLEPGDAASRDLVARVHADDVARLRDAFDQVLSGEAVVGAAGCRYRSRDGQWRLFDVALQPWMESGRPRAVVLTARDVTDDRAREVRRKESEMLEAAAHASALVAADVDGLLRDLGRHLDVVTATSDTAARAEARQMRSTLDRAWVLVKQLRSFDRPDAMHVGLDVNEAIADVATHLERLAGDVVDVIHLLGAEDARVTMSRGDLEEVLAALVIRARHAIHGAGRVVIETRDGSAPPATQVEGAAPRRTVIIQVTDTGIGIDAAVRAALESDAILSHEVAAGDRVALLVGRAGGRVSVESDAVRGTTVRLHLPVSRIARRS